MWEITIEMGNDALSGEQRTAELARLCRLVADRLERGHIAGYLFDVNGNKVGAHGLIPHGSAS